VHTIVRNGQWEQDATSRLLSYNTSLLPSFLQGAKEKGGCPCGVAPNVPEATMRPALALHTALDSPSSTSRRWPLLSLIILTALHFPIRLLAYRFCGPKIPSRSLTLRVRGSLSSLHASLIMHLTIALRVSAGQHTTGDCKTRKMGWLQKTLRRLDHRLDDLQLKLPHLDWYRRALW
jgi:hypothetical protein